MDCLVCLKQFIIEDEFENYNRNPQICKWVILELFGISRDPNVQGLSEDLVVCLGCHRWMEVVGYLMEQLKELQRRVDDSKNELEKKLFESLKVSQAVVKNTGNRMSPSGLDRCVLLKAIEAKTSPQTPPEMNQDEEAGNDHEKTEIIDENREETPQPNQPTTRAQRIEIASETDGGNSAPQASPVPLGQAEEDEQIGENAMDGGIQVQNHPPETREQIGVGMEIVSEQGPSRTSTGSNSLEKSNDNDPETSDVSSPNKTKSGYALREQTPGSTIKEFTRLKNGSFRCNHCSKILANKKHLHCQVQDCGKSFTRKSGRDVHVKMVHVKLLDFKCTWEGCGKLFGKKSNMTRHAKNHEGKDSKCVPLKAVEDKSQARPVADQAQEDEQIGENVMDGGIQAQNEPPETRAQFGMGIELEQGPSRTSTGSNCTPEKSNDNDSETSDVPSRSKAEGGYVLRKRTLPQNKIFDDEDSSESDEEPSNDESNFESELGDGSSSEDGTDDESKARSNDSGVGKSGGGNARRPQGSIISKFTRLRNGSFQCKNCFRILAKGSIYRHNLIHDPRRFKCSFQDCGKRFTLKKHRDIHVKNVHKRRNDSKCSWPRCGERFAQKSDLIEHFKAVHEGKKKCNWIGCGKSYTSNYHLNRHVIIHKGRKDFPCQVEGCDKAFARKDHLKRHKSSHKNMKVTKKRVKVNPQADVMPVLKAEMVECRMTPSCRRVFKLKRSRDTHEDTHVDLGQI